MQTEIVNRFNLVDEPWIPVADKGLVSLRQIFSDSSLKKLHGDPVLKIAITKLLLAIVQASFTPVNNDEWQVLGPNGFAEKANNYLENFKNRFWLFGNEPFLQMPMIEKAVIQNYGVLQFDTATGNTTILQQSQKERALTDAEKAQLLVLVMSFALGGKKKDNSVILSSGYTGKGKTSKPGPSLGNYGYLHNFLAGRNLTETLWLNIITKEQISEITSFSAGLGIPPWERMPSGENCNIANQLKNSYIGRLVPLSRFLLLKVDGLHHSEGIQYPSHKEGGFDLTIAVDHSKEPKVIWANIEKKPWRQLPSLLSFFNLDNKKNYDCKQLRFGIFRARSSVPKFGIWSGGVSVDHQTGEQFVKGNKDYIESEFSFSSESCGETWFNLLKEEMNSLDEISKILYGATSGYFRQLKTDGKKIADLASNLFWQLCEQVFQDLVDACADKTGQKSKTFRKTFALFIDKAYNTYCPKETARQLDAWAANRPNLSKYLSV